MAVSPPPPPGSLPKCIPPSLLMKNTQPSGQNTSPVTGKHSCSGSGSQPSSFSLPPPPPNRILVKFKLPMEARFHLSKLTRPANDASEELKRAWIDSLTPPELKDDPEGLEHFYVAYNTYHDTRKKVMDKMTANFEQAVQDMHKAHPYYAKQEQYAARAMQPGLAIWNECRLSYDEAVQNGTSATWKSPFAHLSKLYKDPKLVPSPNSPSKPPATPSSQKPSASSCSRPTSSPLKPDSVTRDKHVVKKHRNKNGLQLDLGSADDNDECTKQEAQTSSQKRSAKKAPLPATIATQVEVPAPHISPTGSDKSISPQWRIRSLTADSSNDGSVIGSEAGSEGVGSGRSDTSLSPLQSKSRTSLSPQLASTSLAAETAEKEE